MKSLVIYHANCVDGFGAAWAAWKKLGDTADYIPCDYGRPPPLYGEDQDIYIVDFSFPRDVLETMGRTAASVTVLEHHKTAAAALAGPWGPANMDIIFDMDRSGARMAWEYFHDEPAPELIAYIEDRDLWRWKLPGSREFSAAIRSYPFDFMLWDGFSIEKLIGEGVAIQRYVEQQVADLARVAQTTTIAGYLVPTVNAPSFLASEVCNRLATGHPFAASWCASETEIFWSLRSAPDGIDVSAVAKQFGGGGHHHAAGYKTVRQL